MYVTRLARPRFSTLYSTRLGLTWPVFFSTLARTGLFGPFLLSTLALAGLFGPFFLSDPAQTGLSACFFLWPGPDQFNRSGCSL